MKIHIPILISLLSLLLLSACQTTPSPQEEISELESSAEEESPYRTWEDLRKPITDELELPPLEEVVRIPRFRPAWQPNDLPFWVWGADSRDGGILFLGSSFPRASREAEFNRCLETAAIQAAQYAGIAALVSSYRGTFEEGTGFAEDVRLYYDEKLIYELISEAEVLTLEQDRFGSFALIRFPSARTPREADFTLVDRDETEPAWIDAPPVSEEFYIGLGISRSKIRFADSIQAADGAAIADIVSQLATSVDVEYDVIGDGGSGSSFSEESYQYATELVKGVRILRRFRSPDGVYFYSLAIMPKL